MSLPNDQIVYIHRKLAKIMNCTDRQVYYKQQRNIHHTLIRLLFDHQRLEDIFQSLNQWFVLRSTPVIYHWVYTLLEAFQQQKETLFFHCSHILGLLYNTVQSEELTVMCNVLRIDVETSVFIQFLEYWRQYNPVSYTVLRDHLLTKSIIPPEDNVSVYPLLLKWRNDKPFMTYLTKLIRETTIPRYDFLHADLWYQQQVEQSNSAYIIIETVLDGILPSDILRFILKGYIKETS